MKCMALAEVAHGGGLGDLEEDPLGGDAGGLDLGEHVVQEGVVAHRLAGEVDGEAGGVAVREGAAGQGDEGGVDHPAVDRGDQVVALGGGDEGGRGGDAAVLVDHADEDLAERRLGAVAVERMDALPVEAEAVLGERLVDAVDPLHLAVALGERACRPAGTRACGCGRSPWRRSRRRRRRRAPGPCRRCRR